MVQLYATANIFTCMLTHKYKETYILNTQRLRLQNRNCWEIWKYVMSGGTSAVSLTVTIEKFQKQNYI